MTLKTTWKSGKTNGQSVTHKSLFSEDNDLSVEAKQSAGVIGIVGWKASEELDLDFGGSKGTESLAISESEIESATGITISKSGQFADGFSYKYFFSPYIFGKQQPSGFTDPINSDSDLTTFGALRSAFTADPLANGAGGWWKQAYGAAPDVALNHPNRWVYTSLAKTNPIPTNCVGIDGYNMSCVTPAEREPENPWLDPFHDMRGFFVTDARSPGQGPQLTIATEGDRLSLQTRVYNDSLAAMPEGTRVIVRFYGMEWNTGINRPTNEDGQSFLIEKSELDPIAPFSNDPEAPLNWVKATATFDTTNHTGKDVVFWVVVSMQDVDGNPVQELPGKGLTRIPDFGSARFSDLTDLEELVPNPLKAEPSDPDMVSFSNNIGFYRVAVHIQPKNVAATALRPTAANSVNNLEQVKIESVTTEAASIKLGKSEKIHVLLPNGAEAVSGLTVYFYDGDPAQGGKLFDAERLSYVRPGAKHKASVVYRPKQCGMHPIFVKVTQSGTVVATGSAATPLRVTCTVPDSRDQTPPRLEVTLTPDKLWPANGRMIPVTAQITVSDNDDPRPDVVLEAITHNEGQDASGDVEGAAFGTDDRQFALRAARDGRFNLRERVYEVVYSATDWAGNKTFTKAYVTVPRRR